MLQSQSPQYTSSKGSAVISGAVVSSMVKIAVVEEVLSQSSVAVNVTMAMPVDPQSSDKQPAVCTKPRSVEAGA